MHQVEVYETGTALTAEGRRFETGQSWYVPTDQPNYIMVRSIFEKAITYTDSTFYDASTWSLAQAYGMPHGEWKAAYTPGSRLNALPEFATPAVTRSEYAYVFHGTDYNSLKAVYALQEAGIVVQSAFRPFSTEVGGKNMHFGYGSFSIPVGLQRIRPDSIFRVVGTVSQKTGVPIYGVGSGFNSGGIDLGSNYSLSWR
jgi:hypothetical protein